MTEETVVRSVRIKKKYYDKIQQEIEKKKFRNLQHFIDFLLGEKYD